MQKLIAILGQHGIQPTPQRIAVAEYILTTKSHPSADEIWEHVRRACQTISRATVYNTLNLFVEKNLITSQVLREGTIVFDPRVDAHHHFIDTHTGEIFDVPWDALKVSGARSLRGFDVVDYQVIMRGRRRRK